jgi:3-hydroxyisobutyrate dehydrogenase-like beta-hydroxyacid dehydrogenase
MANLGYIGLGVMGSRMVDRLMIKGHTVVGHNRTKSKAQWLIDQIMAWGDSPRAVAGRPWGSRRRTSPLFSRC